VSTVWGEAPPYLIRLAYELCGGADWQSIAPACAAVEVLNISSYQANVAFDGKLTVSTQEERAQQFGCSMLSLECATRLLEKLDVPSASTIALIRGMHHANCEMYLGQIMDLNELQIGAMSRANIIDFIDKYRERCRRLGGAFTSWCLQVGALLAGANESDLARLSQIGVEMGIAGQMVNDVGDYVTVELPAPRAQTVRYQHVYSDLLNGKATYPLLFAVATDAAEAVETAKRLHREQVKDLNILHAFSKQLHQIGAFEATHKVIKAHYKAARLILHSFRPSLQRRYFSLALSTLTHNKYFTALRASRLTRKVILHPCPTQTIQPQLEGKL